MTIKLNVMYPQTEGARFDHAYYRDRHIPLLASRLGAACLGYTIEKGLSGRAPSIPAPYVASCGVLCESVEVLQAALSQHGKEIMADIVNYTDIKPLMWISSIEGESS